ncbi:hypothetical protein QAD02_022096 [Eretmocerus hayati]|uniref:Uncharacterized protein n=1 Tax=Eretmocerus hayati TaxID=131215 RepID=A0ACC2PSB4_9HYME|nr:hypothetical protein QAD02_022096 [Eretmocerus hayati]
MRVCLLETKDGQVIMRWRVFVLLQPDKLGWRCGICVLDYPSKYNQWDGWTGSWGPPGDQLESSASSPQHWSNDSEASELSDTSSTESHVSESIRSDYSDGGGTIGKTSLSSEINRTYPINIKEVVEGSVIRYDSESDEYFPIDQAQEQLNENPVMGAPANIVEIPRTRAQMIDVHRQVSRFMNLLYNRGFRYPRNALDDVIRRREANEWQASQQRIQ